MLLAGATAAGMLAAPAANAADNVSQLPGASADGTVVIVDSPRITVTVDPHEASNDTVKVHVKNNYDHNFSCFAPGVSTDANKPTKLPNVVTEAGLVKKAVDFYRKYPSVPSDGINFPLLGVIPTNPFLQYVPEGILSKAFGESLVERATMFRDWERARIAGHTSEVPVFELGKFETKSFDAKLGIPGNGNRAEFDAAALVYCTDNQETEPRSYVFAGYENGKAPAGNGSLGSPGIASPSAGSPGISSPGISSLGR
nr:hypothetical protein [Corynebacterium lactis]